MKFSNRENAGFYKKIYISCFFLSKNIDYFCKYDILIYQTFKIAANLPPSHGFYKLAQDPDLIERFCRKKLGGIAGVEGLEQNAAGLFEYTL